MLDQRELRDAEKTRYCVVSSEHRQPNGSSCAWLGLVSVMTMAVTLVDMVSKSVSLHGRRGRRRNDGGDDLRGGGCDSGDRPQSTSFRFEGVHLFVDIKNDLSLDVDDCFGNGGFNIGCGGRGSPGGHRGCALGGRGTPGGGGGPIDPRQRTGIGRSILNSETGRQTALVLSHILILQLVRHLEGAFLLVALTLNIEDIAVRDLARGVCAAFHGLLEDTGFPAVNEIGVISVAGRVGIGEHEPAFLALESISVPDGFKEKRDNAGLIALGACSIHNQRWVGDMRPVVLRVTFLSVPARWEHDLEANTIGAVRVKVRLVGQVVAAERRLRILVVVQTVESESLLAEGLLGGLFAGPFRFRGVRNRPREVAQVGVTGNHAKVVGKRGHILSVKQVVTRGSQSLVSNAEAFSNIRCRLTQACLPLAPQFRYRHSCP